MPPKLRIEYIDIMTAQTTSFIADKSILIATASKVETQAVQEIFRLPEKRWATRKIGDGNKIYYDLGIHGGVPVFMVQSEQGSITPGGAGLTIKQAISELRPQAVIMCGIAFGLQKKKQQLGDILIAKRLQNYEFRKTDTRQGQIARGDRATAPERLLARFRNGENQWQGKAKTCFGLVLSGEKLANDLDFRDSLLKEEPEAIGGEMEGTGLYAAAREAKTDWILVKAICDWADGSKDDAHQLSAARNAAQFVLHVLQLGGWEIPEQSKLPSPNVGKITQRKSREFSKKSSVSFDGLDSGAGQLPETEKVRFDSQLGNPEKLGFLVHEKRWNQYYKKKGENPFYEAPLQGNSPVFYGRADILRKICNNLQRSQARFITLVGEKGFGKTSLLNQVYTKLSTAKGLITLYGRAKNWQNYTQQAFFKSIFHAICNTLPAQYHNKKEVVDFPYFQKFIREQALNYRFVVIVDDVEDMVERNKDIDAAFFSLLRSIANDSGFRLTYLFSSRLALDDLLSKEKIKNSSLFSLIFSSPYVLGLLTDDEAKRLIQEPLEKSLDIPAKELRVSSLLRDIGRHPAMIQMVMSISWENWNNSNDTPPDDYRRIEYDMEKYFKNLLDQRTKKELKVLKKLTEGKIKRNTEYADLSWRGLITSEGYLFSKQFYKYTQGKKGKSIKKTLDEINADIKRCMMRNKQNDDKDNNK